MIFQFAIQGKDTASEVGYSFHGINENKDGCCYNPEDNFCYKNSLKEECEKKQGIYSELCSCSEVEIKPKINLNPINGCQYTYNRESNSFSGNKKNNE